MDIKNTTWHMLNTLKETGGKEISAETSIRSGSLWYDGHFPGFPILPGIAQLALVSDALREHARTRGENIAVVAIRRVRFRQHIMPDDILQVTAVPDEQDPAAYKFKVLANGQVACNGIMMTAQRNNS